MNATTYAIDTAKNVMQLHWVDPGSGEIARKKLTRAKLLEFFAQRQPAVVVLEACPGSHHWARSLAALGHQVQLLPARHVRAFVRGNKDDAADARAIWLAAQQSDIRRVPVKTVEQQAVQSLHRTREHWITVRTATVNALRGLLAEFGVWLPQGRRLCLRQLAEQRAPLQSELPEVMQRLLHEQLRAIGQIDQHIALLDREIAQMAKALPAAQVLIQVPGIGVLGATALAAALGDGSGWPNARAFSATLGLCPSHTGTGGKSRNGPISRRGDPYLRTLLVSGAHSVLISRSRSEWMDKLLLRRPANVVAVAIANKLARTAWALIARARRYEANWNMTGSPAHLSA
jgi:transposase